ncbi:hypothetical protein KJ693_07135 [bacterium]|nr:hypothetical protein [bacterium]
MSRRLTSEINRRLTAQVFRLKAVSGLQSKCLQSIYLSYLIYAEYEDRIIHIQIATDLEDDNVTIVTTYKPTLDKWEEDFKTRRKL